MTAKIVKMELGTYTWQVAGINSCQQWLEWQAYDFFSKKWVLGKDYTMFIFPQLGDFDNKLRNIAKQFDSDVTIYAYDSNEFFGALRKIDYWLIIGEK